MTINEIDQSRLHELLRQRLDAREWWVVAVGTSGGYEMLKFIAERHYDGEPGFKLIYVPRLLAIAFLPKRQMSALELAKCLCEYWDTPGLLEKVETDLLSRDLVIEDGIQDVVFTFLGRGVDG